MQITVENWTDEVEMVATERNEERKCLKETKWRQHHKQKLGRKHRVRRTIACMRQEICYSSTTVIEEENGKLTLQRSTQKWDTKTGKEIKLDKTDATDCSSTSVGSDPSSFLNVLTPVTDDNFNLCNPSGSSCDLFNYEDDVPGRNGVQAGQQTVFDLMDGKAWVETQKPDDKKSTLSNF